MREIKAYIVEDEDFIPGLPMTQMSLKPEHQEAALYAQILVHRCVVIKNRFGPCRPASEAPICPQPGKDASVAPERAALVATLQKVGA